jgi:hypothetical protein
MKTYKISVEFTDQPAENPLEAVRKFISALEEDMNLLIYDVEDEETGEKFTVDMSEFEDEDKVLPNNN